MSSGVPAGAAMPHQLDAMKPGKPDSAMVGTSGSIGMRCSVATARAVSLPSRKLLPTAAKPTGKSWMSFCSSASVAGGEPR